MNDVFVDEMPIDYSYSCLLILNSWGSAGDVGIPETSLEHTCLKMTCESVR